MRLVEFVDHNFVRPPETLIKNDGQQLLNDKMHVVGNNIILFLQTVIALGLVEHMQRKICKSTAKGS